MYPEKTLDRNKNLSPEASRVVYRRRISLIRATLVALIISVALIFFIFWYLTWPHRMDCAKQSQRIAMALENSLRQTESFPPRLESLSIKPGRFGLEHYEYYFTGIGGPGFLPEGTIVAYCLQPHRPLFSEPWRNALIYQKGHLVIQWMTEDNFQKLLAKQHAPEQYYRPSENRFSLP
jgi:hypothetical protein